MQSYNSCGPGFVEGGARVRDVGEEFGALCLPLVGLWIGVAFGKISLDITHQFVDRADALQ